MADTPTAVRALAQVGLDETVELDPRETITRETLDNAATRKVQGPGAPGAPAPKALGIATLPRLELELPHSSVPPPSEPDLIVRDVIGVGGMGAIYLADQRSLAREVALKTVRVRGEEAEEALVVEGAITGKLEHPGIPPVHALGRSTDGRPVIVMKRVRGVSWVELLDDDEHPRWPALRMLPAARLDAHLRILVQVAEAVQYAHDQGFAHRDVKPENVMVGEHGEVWLLDWGIATRFSPGARCDLLIGTPAYMSPEQVTGGPLDVRTDVYLLGAALHYVLVRKPRHDATTIQGILDLATRSAPFDYPRAIPHELASLANRACALEPPARPPSAFAFREALEKYFASRASSAIAASAWHRLKKLEQRIGAGGSLEGEAAVEALRLSSAARFGFAEALRESPENPSASEGLARCLRATARLEIARENPAAARAALGELVEPDRALEGEVATLERRLRRRADEASRLRQLAHDRDTAFAVRKHRWFVFILAGFVLVFGAGLLLFVPKVPFDEPAGRRYVSVGLAYLSFALVLGAVLRKPLGASLLSRRMYTGLVIVLAVFAAHRFLAAARGDPLWASLETDNLILAAGTLGLGALTHRAWLGAGAIFFVTSLLVHFFPGYARTLSGLAAPIATALAAAVILGERPDEPPPSATR